MILHSPWLVNRYDPPTSVFTNLALAFFLIRLLPYAPSYPYLDTAFS